MIRKRLLTAQSRQKSYADVRRRPLEFKVGDHVFLKVMPKRGVIRFRKRGKLLPRYIGPFEVLERVGAVAYRLALSPSLSTVHEVFHVSMLRKYTPDPTHIVDWGELVVDADGTFEEGPVRIMDSREQVLRGKTVRLVKVLWKHRGVEEATWECEDTIRANYPSCLKGKVCFLVINVLNDCCICMWLIVCMYAEISGRNSFKGGRTVKPGKAYFFFLK